MKEQLQELGCEFDWDLELSTCDPAYYRHTQTIFAKMVEEKIAHKHTAYVNWDPVAQTVLANE